MRKELEALADLRSVMAARVASIELSATFDLLHEIQISMALALRLVGAGVLAEEDWAFAEHAHQHVSEGGKDLRMVRAKIRFDVAQRLSAAKPPLSSIDLPRADAALDDLTAFVVECAVLRRYYTVLADGVVDCLQRFVKSRVMPPSDRAERLQRVYYRDEDPDYVLH